MEFPHLSNDKFPYAGNVDTAAYPDDFDYSLWTEDTIITLCSVAWDRDYRNVVDWKSDEERDNYIKEHAIKSFNLNSRQWIQPGGSVKLPVPFSVLNKVNYIMVEFPKPPVQYGQEDQITKYFYFIDSVGSKAPSTTEAYISLDYWTTYINNTNVTYLMLERGHAPMSVTNVKDYLNNPLENNKYLLTPDVNFGSADIVKTQESAIFNAGDMLAVIASTGYPNFDELWGSEEDENWRVLATEYYRNQGVPGVFLSALPAEELQELITDVQRKCPQFIQTIQAVYFIQKGILVLNTAPEHTYNFCGHTLNGVLYFNDVYKSFEISADKFDYDEKYADITKLYTSPYAELELADSNGVYANIKIEDTTGKLDIMTALSLAYPSIAIDTWVNGIGGNKANNYIFKSSETLHLLGAGDWQKTLKSFAIPSYAITQSNQVTNEYSNWYNRRQATYAAIEQYDRAVENNQLALDNATRSANTSYDTTIASNKTANDNALASNKTANDNALASNLTGYNNAIASNATANANALASNATSQTNTLASNSTAQTNALASNTATFNATADGVKFANDNNTTDYNLANIQKDYANELLDNTADYSAKKSRIDMAIGNVLTHTSQDLQTGAATASMVGQVVGGGIAGAFAGGGIGAIGGATAAGLNSIVSIGVGQATASNQTLANNTSFFLNYGNTEISSTDTGDFIEEYNKYSGEIQGNSLTGIWNSYQKGLSTRQTNSSNLANLAKTQANQNLILGGNGRILDTNNTITNSSNEYAGTANITKNTSDANANRSKETADANTNRNKTMSDANANRSKATADSNAAASKTTADENANRSKTTADANANRSKTTADANALINKNTAITNATNSKLQADKNVVTTRNIALRAIQAGVDTANISAPNIYGTFANTKGSTTRPQGIYINVKTQNEGEIAQAGDQMLRYGYTLNQAWKLEQKQLMQHFTYWQASDIWIECCRAGIEDAGETIEAIFRAGTTVWSNPDEIGKVSIYDNMGVNNE